NDLSPLIHANELRELHIDGKQVSGLPTLQHLKNLVALTVIDSTAIDLSPISYLNLKTLFIWGPPIFDFRPLSKLVGLQELQISGLLLAGLSPVSNINALDKLRL